MYCLSSWFQLGLVNVRRGLGLPAAGLLLLVVSRSLLDAHSEIITENKEQPLLDSLFIFLRHTVYDYLAPGLIS